MGPIEVIVHSERRELRPAQRRLLSIMLLRRRGIHSADALIENLWSGAPPSTARTALHVHLTGLRSAAPGLIETVAGGYRLSSDRWTFDVDDFDRHSRRASDAASSADWESALDAAETALGYWRGRPLPDLDGEQMADPEVHRILELRLELETLRTRSLLALGRTEETIPDLRSLVDANPFNEQLREQLMVAYYRSGRAAEALRVCNDARRLLGEELGVELSPSLRRLEQRILTHDPTLGSAAPPPTPHSLPAVTTSYVGRATSLASTADLLDASRLVTITGGPGVGKTRFAVELGFELLDRFPAGVWFASLAGARDRRSVLATIVAALGLEEQVTRLEQLPQAFGSRPQLLILDNCEHVLEPVRVFTRSLLGPPGPARIVATSRSPIAVDGERVVALQPLTEDVESAQLLVERVRQLDPSFALNDATAAGVARLGARLSGIPLGIELAARWIPTLGVSETARLLETTHTGNPLQTALDWSFGLLVAGDRDMMARLSILRAPFTFERAHEICGTAHDELATAGSISRLAQASLVHVEAAQVGTTRYRLLEPIREYAAAKLVGPSRTDLTERHARSFAESAIRLGPALRGAAQAAALAEVDREIADFRASMAWLAAGGHWPEVVNVASALDYYWYARFLGWEGRAWLSDALENDLAASDRARALLSEGFLAWAVHDYVAADASYVEAHRIGKEIGNPAIAADALYGRGLIHHKRRFENGVAMLTEAAGIFDELPDTTLRRGECRLFLGLHEAMRGDAGRAQDLLTEAVRLLDDAANPRQLSKAHRWLAHCAWRLDDRATARAEADRAEELARSTGDRPALAGALIEQAFVEISWGSPNVAATRLDEALGLLPDNDLVDACQVLTPAVLWAIGTDNARLAGDIADFIARVYDEAGWLPATGVAALSSIAERLPHATGGDGDIVDRVRRALAAGTTGVGLPAG